MATSVKIRSQQSIEIKEKLSHLTSPTVKKEAQRLVGFLGSVKLFSSQKNLCLGILLRPICQVALGCQI